MQRPFDPELSYRLNAVIILLDYRSPWIVRMVLRPYKRYLEGGV